jgi:hypothetical protein
MGMLSQPGRFGGERITPLSASSGPPQETPKTGSLPASIPWIVT